MKALFIEFLSNFWELINAVAIFILIGVIVAGIFKLLLHDSFIRKHLGGNHFFSNIKAALVGIPLPLCSYNVIPFVTTLNKSGASSSSIQTFLISTPITGADSIIVTYGVFGWLFTIYRVISSIIIALITGFLTLIFVKEKPNLKDEKIGRFTAIHIPVRQEGQPPENKTYQRYKQVMSYAFDEIFKDIAKPLLIGTIIGALIATFMPEGLANFLSDNQTLNYLLILAISMPLYVCATASIPLGLSLLSVGFSPGTAFIFLTVGPASNIITMGKVLKTLGKISLVIHLSAITIGSLIFGVVLDSFFIDSLNNILNIKHNDEQAGFISQISSVIMLYLSIKYSFNKKTQIINSGGCGSCEN